MKRILLSLLVLPAIAGAQTASLTPPLVALPMPAPRSAVTAGQNVTLSWGVVTQSTTGQPLVGAVTAACGKSRPGPPYQCIGPRRAHG